MKSLLALVAVASLAFAGAVQAHAKLERSQPAANSTVTASPANVQLEFSQAVQLTVLTLQAGDAKGKELGPLPKTASGKITVPLPALAKGSYTLTWRAVSSDNHVMSGTIPFKVDAGAHH
jgi:methionine-rich copper-binding protein CopC